MVQNSLARDRRRGRALPVVAARARAGVGRVRDRDKGSHRAALRRLERRRAVRDGHEAFSGVAAFQEVLARHARRHRARSRDDVRARPLRGEHLQDGTGIASRSGGRADFDVEAAGQSCYASRRTGRSAVLVALEGKIKNRNGKLYVLFVIRSTPSRYAITCGGACSSRTATNTAWRAPKTATSPYTRTTAVGTRTTATDLPGARSPATARRKPSSSRQSASNRPRHAAKELRWHEGRWEKLMASGWVPAGEGGVKVKIKTRTT